MITISGSEYNDFGYEIQNKGDKLSSYFLSQCLACCSESCIRYNALWPVKVVFYGCYLGLVRHNI